MPKGFEEAIMEKMPPGRLKNKNALLTFAHYEIFNLLEQYKTAIWLDIDTAIQGDISGLQQYGPLGMAEDKHTCGVFTASVNFASTRTTTDATKVNSLAIISSIFFDECDFLD